MYAVWLILNPKENEMRLVYTATQKEVKVGDIIHRNGEKFEVEHFREPHKPASSGHVTVLVNDSAPREFYVCVIGAEWIEREDR